MASIKKVPIKLMTEAQFLAKFKKLGFGLYKNAAIKAIYSKIERIEKAVKS